MACHHAARIDGAILHSQPHQLRIGFIRLKTTIESQYMPLQMLTASLDAPIQPGQTTVSHNHNRRGRLAGLLCGGYLLTQAVLGLAVADQPVDAPLEPAWTVARVKRGDTLSRIFQRHGLPVVQAIRIAALDTAAELLSIRPGEAIKLMMEDRRLMRLSYAVSALETLQIHREDNRFVAAVQTRQPTIRIRAEHATIWGSLLGAANDADIGHSVIYQFIELFGSRVDFTTGIRAGDRFSIIFEEHYLDNKKRVGGQILAAELSMHGKTLYAIRHIDDSGAVEYYAPDGSGVKSAFLRTPMQFARVTSGYQTKRYHPILKKWRAHRGVDYGAPMKTPILATGNGTVRLVGSRRGYGRTVIIRHNEKIQTLYAHMHYFAAGIRPGSRVEQGDVIGYVGQTGWATGPHLHYEFQVHGRHMDPLTVELPDSQSIEKKYLAEFVRHAGQQLVRLNDLKKTAIARNQPPDESHIQ